MKKILVKLFLLILIIMGSNRNTYADHLAGSDITYSCTSTAGVYKITYVHYRMCSGMELCYSGCGGACLWSVALSGADGTCTGSSFGSVSLSLVSVSDINVNPLCPNAKSICQLMGCEQAGTYTPGIEKYVFEGTVDLNSLSIPSTCCKIKLSYSTCCRSADITTGSTWQNYYVEATIDRCSANNTPCNSGPVFTNDPVAILCANQGAFFNPGAVDPDGDSLTYAFAPSLSGMGQSVTYDAPYSYDKPLPYLAPDNLPFPYGIRCDAITGDIGVTPVWSGSDDFVGVVAIEITQWRYINSVATNVGVTRRDITIFIKSCDVNNSPTLLTNPPSSTNATKPNTAWEVCAGQTLCFDIIGKDTDYKPNAIISDTTYLSWNSALAAKGATFLPKYTLADRNKPAPTGGPREDIYQFCWTPSVSDARNLPHYFTVDAKDTRCPIPGKVSRSFSIKVSPGPDITLTKTVNCGKATISYTKNNASQTFSSVAWHISKTPNDWSLTNTNNYTNTATTPTQTFTQSGKYLVQLVINTSSCETIFTDTLIIDLPTISVNDTLICKGSSATFTYKATGGESPYTYRWFIAPDTSLNVLNSSIVDTSFSLSPIKSTRYTIQARDANGCRAYDSTVWVTISSPTFATKDSARICNGASYTLDKGNNNGNAKSYLWSTGDTTRTIISNATLTATIKITDTIGCSNIDTFSLYVNAAITPNAGIDTTVCGNRTITLRGSGGQLYQWKNLTTNTLLTSKTSTANTSTLLNGNASYEVTAFATQGSLECSNKDTIAVTVNTLPALTRPQVVQACRSASIVSLNTFTNNLSGGTEAWSYPTAPGAVTNGSTPQVLIDSLKNFPSVSQFTYADNWIKYSYTAPASSGSCVAIDSAIVRVFSNPPTYAGSDKNVCTADAAFILTDVQNASPLTGTWTGTGVSLSGTKYMFTPSQANLAPATNTLYYAYTHTYNTSVSCSNIDTVIFTVSTSPIVEAGSGMSLCASDAAFELTPHQQATPAGGVWSGTGVSLSGTKYMFDPSLANSTTNKLYYSYTNAANCSSSDSVVFTVNPKPQTPVVFGSDTVMKSFATDYLVSNTAGSTYTWFVENGTISNGQGSNLVSAVFNVAGSNNIKVIETAASTCVSDTGIKTIVVDQVTGVDEQTTFDHFSLYPNPTTGLVTIELKTAEKHLSLEVVDVLGKVVKTAQYSPSIADFTTTLDLGQLKPGLYFITIKGGNKTAQSKITLK